MNYQLSIRLRFNIILFRFLYQLLIVQKQLIPITIKLNSVATKIKKIVQYTKNTALTKNN